MLVLVVSKRRRKAHGYCSHGGFCDSQVQACVPAVRLEGHACKDVYGKFLFCVLEFPLFWEQVRSHFARADCIVADDLNRHHPKPQSQPMDFCHMSGTHTPHATVEEVVFRVPIIAAYSSCITILYVQQTVVAAYESAKQSSHHRVVC